MGGHEAELDGLHHEHDDHDWNQHLEFRVDPGWSAPPPARPGRAHRTGRRLPGQGRGDVGHETGRSSVKSLSKSLAIGQQKPPGCTRPGNYFHGTSKVEGTAGGSRAARCGQPERHGPVMKFGPEMLVAARAKSMLK